MCNTGDGDHDEISTVERRGGGTSTSNDASSASNDKSNIRRNRSTSRQSLSGYYHQKVELSPRCHMSYDKLLRSESDATAGLGKLSYAQNACKVFRKCLSQLPYGRCHSRSDRPSRHREQYRIPPREEAAMSFQTGIRSFVEGSFINSTTWCYRAPFMNVFAVFVLLYLLWIVVFMLIIMGCGRLYEAKGSSCVSGWSDGLAVPVSFSLSWTTFSTVGYGSVSTTTLDQCMLLRLVLAFEAFFGLMYAGFASAICYAKIARLHSRAHVVFSSVMCLKYGLGATESYTGVGEIAEQARSSDDDGSFAYKSDEESQNGSFPVLTFQIINERANENNAVLLNVKVSCMVYVNTPLGQIHVGHGQGVVEHNNIIPEHKRKGSSRKVQKSAFRRSICKINFEPEQEPLFSKVWCLHHRLDGDSPLLKQEVRDYIKANGRWPRGLRSHIQIREDALLKFEGIVVTLEGTSNTLFGTVFAEKLFRYEDLYIGWKFAQVLYINGKQKTDDYFYDDLKVDMDLVHDILPQLGGGNEPLGS